MRQRSQRRCLTTGLALTVIVSSVLVVRSSASARAQDFPGAISDQELWRIVTEFSEPGGAFPREFMSNEDSAQFVIPTLKETARPGGIYIGVGAEQNFTYIAALRPKIAFVVDIRRDNMLLHLMYKALFELSADRADFVSRLFSRQRPTGVGADSTVKALFEAYEAIAPDRGLFQENLRAVVDRLVHAHTFQLRAADEDAIARIMYEFGGAGPYGMRGRGDLSVSFAHMMMSTDLAGREHGFLASEENFRIVRDIQKQNLIVPLVGDFAGDKTIVSVGRYLKEHGATVNVFYVSNVERYLFEQGARGRRFYGNVAALPLDASSTFIRSVTVDISRRLGIRIPSGVTHWRSFLFSIRDCLKAFDAGRLDTYGALFEGAG